MIHSFLIQPQPGRLAVPCSSHVNKLTLRYVWKQLRHWWRRFCCKQQIGNNIIYRNKLLKVIKTINIICKHVFATWNTSLRLRKVRRKFCYGLRSLLRSSHQRFVSWITFNVANVVCDCRTCDSCLRPFVNRAPGLNYLEYDDYILS